MDIRKNLTSFQVNSCTVTLVNEIDRFCCIMNLMFLKLMNIQTDVCVVGKSADCYDFCKQMPELLAPVSNVFLVCPLVLQLTVVACCDCILFQLWLVSCHNNRAHKM